MMPKIMPRVQLIIRAVTDSSMVAGKRCRISIQTFWRVQMVSPKSSVTRRLRNKPYWT